VRHPVTAALALTLAVGTAACRDRAPVATDTTAAASGLGGDAHDTAEAAPPAAEVSEAWFERRCREACAHVGALIKADVGALEGASDAFLGELDALAGAPCIDRCVDARDLAATTCVLAATDLLSLGSCQPRPTP
jgi:hypothetical protein